jgi:hypothetical protein
MFCIVDGKGDAATNNITITPDGSETINGAATYVINGDRNGIIIAYNGSEWTIIAEFLSSSAGSIPRAQIAAGTADYVLINDGSGNMSEEATLAASRGGLGTDASAFTGVLKASTGTMSASALVNADVDAAAAIAYSKLNLATSIVNADISASAAIVDTKLDTIATALKVSNSATTATSANTASAIVARDGSGNFTAGTITANLTGNASGTAANVTGTVAIANGGTGQTGATAAFGALSPVTTQGDLIVRGAANNERLAVGSEGQTLKVTSGVPAWGDAGGGSGEKNYITNPSAASAITGWEDGANTYLTAVRTTTDTELPREFTTGTGIKIVASVGDPDTEYVFYDFTLDDVDLNKKLKIQWSQKQFGSYVAGDLEVYIAAQSDRAVILHTPDVTTIPAYDEVFTASFDTASTATLSLVIRATTDMATDAGIVISDVIIGPGQIMPVPAIGPIITVPSPTIVGPKADTTYTTKILRYSQDIDRMHVEVGVTINAVGSGASQEVNITIPASLTIDTSKIALADPAQILGVAQFRNNAGSVYLDGNVIYKNTTTVRFISDAGSGNSWDSTRPATWAAGDRFTARFTVPIAEWAGAPNYAGSNAASYASQDGTHIVYCQSGAALLTTTPAGSSEVLTITSAFPNLQADDRFTIDIQRGGSGPFMPNSSEIDQLRFDGTNYFGLGVRYNGTDVQIIRGKYRSGSTDLWSAITAGTRAVVTRHKAGSAIGFSAATQTSLGLVKAGQVPGTNTNDNAVAGYVGEYIDTVTHLNTSAAFSTGGTNQNMASMVLTAGDWDVMGRAGYAYVSSPTVTGFIPSISLVSGTSDTVSRIYATPTTGAVDNKTIVGGLYRRISVSTTTTIYMVSGTIYSGGEVRPNTDTAMWARRVR